MSQGIGTDCAVRSCSVWLWCGQVYLAMLLTVTQWHGAAWGVPYDTVMVWNVEYSYGTVMWRPVELWYGPAW